MQTQTRDFLIVSPYFPPSGAPTAKVLGALASHLLSAGNTVDVVCAGESNLEPAIASVRDKAVDSGNLKIYRFESSGSFARQSLLIKSYRLLKPTDPYIHLGGLMRTLQTVLDRNRYRFLLSIADPLASHEAVLQMRRPPVEKIAFYFSDPVPCVEDRHMMRLRARRRHCQGLANQCVKAGAVCWAPTEETFCFFQGDPELRERLMVVPHYFAAQDWPFPPAAKPPTEVMTVLHCGALYYTRRPHVLLDGVAALRARSGVDVRARLLGYCDPEIRASVEDTRYRGFASFEDSVPSGAAKRAITEADIVCIIDCDLPRNVHLPSKVAEYVGACKPILYIGRSDSPTCRLLRGMHPAFEQASSPEQVTNAIQGLLERSRTARPDEYRPSYEMLRVDNAARPLLARLNGNEA
jgi:hypothetical protein